MEEEISPAHIKEKIRKLKVEKDDAGKIARIGFYFGMGHFFEVRVDEDGKTIFCLGETHHGIEIDASAGSVGVCELQDALATSGLHKCGQKHSGKAAAAAYGFSGQRARARAIRNRSKSD